MLTRYCPHCWHEVAWAETLCPQCGGAIAEGDVSFAEKLIGALHHPEPTRACLAAEMLGRLREPRAVGPLLDVLAHTQDPVMMAECAASLGEIADPAAMPALMDLLTDAAASVMARCAAAKALGAFSDDRASRALRRAKVDPRPTVARVAMHILGQRKRLESSEENSLGTG